MHAGRGVGGGPGQLLVAQRRVDHRVRAALGERVVAEVDHGVGVDEQVTLLVRGQREVVGQRDVAADRAQGRRSPSASTRRRACRRRRARAAAARSRGRCCRRRGPATPAGCGRAAPAPPRRPRSGRAGRGRAGRAPRACRATSVSFVSASATSGAGGLETTTTRSTSGSASSRRRASRVARPPTADDRSRPPTPSAWRTPTPSARLAGVVQEGEELLAAGAGGGDDADPSGTDRVGEARARRRR